jgi:hypothetical protein
MESLDSSNNERKIPWAHVLAHIDDVDNYAGEITIRQLNKSISTQLTDSVIYEAVLHNAFPISIGSLSLDNQAENTIQKLTVTVAYENFENKTK